MISAKAGNRGAISPDSPFQNETSLWKPLPLLQELSIRNSSSELPPDWGGFFIPAELSRKSMFRAGRNCLNSLGSLRIQLFPFPTKPRKTLLQKFWAFMRVNRVSLWSQDKRSRKHSYLNVQWKSSISTENEHSKKEKLVTAIWCFPLNHGCMFKRTFPLRRQSAVPLSLFSVVGFPQCSLLKLPHIKHWIQGNSNNSCSHNPSGDEFEYKKEG